MISKSHSRNNSFNLNSSPKKYNLLPTSNLDSNPTFNHQEILLPRSKLTNRSLFILLFLIFIGILITFTKKSSTNNNSLSLTYSVVNDRWTQLKLAGWGGNSAEEMIEIQEEELLLEAATNLLDLDYDLKEDKIIKKLLFPHNKVIEVQNQIENGEISHYHFHAELQEWSGESTSSEGRLIIVGDIHGCYESLTKLLARLSFDQSTDRLLHSGDIISKSPLADSLETVRILRHYNAQGVRGNHDQGVIEWRRWMLAYGNTEVDSDSLILKQNEGVTGPDKYKIYDKKSTIYKTPSKYSKVKFPHTISDQGLDLTTLASEGALTGQGWQWLNLELEELEEIGVVIPETWDWNSKWKQIAQHLTLIDYEYIENLPLTLHLKDFNTYLVHASLFKPDDFNTFNSSQQQQQQQSKPSTSKPLPLPPLINSVSKKTFVPSEDDSRLFSTFERSVLLVKENIEPFTLIETRALLGSGTKDDPWIVTKKKVGIPWNEVWNIAMKNCDDEEGCEPINVIYGHWASAGLNIKEHSYGLDSGCVSGPGKQLSAMIISPSDSSISPLSISPSYSLEAFRALIPSTQTYIQQFSSSSSSKSNKLESKPMKNKVKPLPFADSGSASSNGFWKPDGISSINKEMIEDGVGIAEKRIRKRQINGEFDDLPILINKRKAWVVSLACPDLEAKSRM